MKRKTENKNRRLKLNKQTVRELGTDDLEQIVGGATKTRITCTSCESL